MKSGLPYSPLTRSVQNVASAKAATAFGPPAGGTPTPVRKAMLSVPPPAFGIDPGMLVSDVTVSTVVVRIFWGAIACDKNRLGLSSSGCVKAATRLSGVRGLARRA